jgi:5'-nucleotidase
MNNKSENIALIDLDGTVVDYHKAMLNKLEQLRSPNEKPIISIEDSPSWIEARMELIKNVPGFWRELPVIDDGLYMVTLLKTLGFSLTILTKGPKHCTPAWSEKYEWCLKNLPDCDVTITQDKGLVYGKVLFDDYPPYVERWLKWRPRGTVLMLEQPWNEYFSHPSVLKVPRLKFDISNHEDYNKIITNITNTIKERYLNV